MLHELNRRFETDNVNILTTDFFLKWVFETDLHEEFKVFNACHLTGLLLARCKARFDPKTLRAGDYFPNFVHCTKKTSELSLRQFRESVEDLQSHWNEYFENENIVCLIDGLFTRFGSLNLCPQQNLDDITNMDPNIPHRISNEAIRRFTSIFCVMYRHVYIDMNCVELDDHNTECPDIQSYHRQAGLDAFYEHAMYADLPPAARITYKQDFLGMYHSVPQVVYFHYPDYARKRQVDLTELKKGTMHLHCLSVALELKPDMKVKFEDDVLSAEWSWIILSGGRVYLQNPEKRFFTASSIWTLLKFICQ